MRELDVLNLKTKQPFVLKFENFREQRNFMVKAKHSKEIKVIGFSYDNEQEYLELSRYL